MCLAQSQTIRIRFVDGKTGKPLTLKYFDMQPSENDYRDYTFKKLNKDVLQVTFKNSSTFQFDNQAYDRCDAKDQNAAQIKYEIRDIVDHGVVSPNICGTVHASPVKGELVIYSRRENWWKTLGRLKGLLICG